MAQHEPLTDSDWLAPWRGAPDRRPGHPSCRYEEGLGFDTNLPVEFLVGLSNGSGGLPNHNANVFEKYPEETFRERAHVGSAAWVEAPDHLGSFVDGVQDSDRGEYGFDIRDGGHYARPGHAVVRD